MTYPSDRTPLFILMKWLLLITQRNHFFFDVSRKLWLRSPFLTNFLGKMVFKGKKDEHEPTLILFAKGEYISISLIKQSRREISQKKLWRKVEGRADKKCTKGNIKWFFMENFCKRCNFLDMNLWREAEVKYSSDHLTNYKICNTRSSYMCLKSSSWFEKWKIDSNTYYFNVKKFESKD